MRDIFNNVVLAQVLAPQTIQAAALNSGNIDMQGYGSLAIAVLIGAMGESLGANDRIDLKIEHADDDGTGAPGAYSACEDSDVLGFTGLAAGVFYSVDADAKAGKSYTIGYRGGKRFAKVTATPVSLATGGPIAMLAAKGDPTQSPVAQNV